MSDVQDIKISDILVDESKNFRIEYDTTALEEAIKDRGLETPVVISKSKEKGKYELQKGHRAQ